MHHAQAGKAAAQLAARAKALAHRHLLLL